MTFETGVYQDRDTLAGMAILAAISIGLVQDISDQCRTVAAMGVVTGATIAQFGWIIAMLLPQRPKRVTSQAKRIWFFDQQISIGRLMRLMACGAFPLGIWRMSIFELPGQVGVAVEADIRGMLDEQSCLVRGMGFVTAQALSLFKRLVHYTLLLFIGYLGVAGKADVLHLFHKQAAESGYMGVVTAETISVDCRFMFHPFLKRIPFMA